ncbi:DNA ligase I, ATP-dependent Dnl1 [Chthoniobacter flavus Ellin428]|uniref:DNA ligase n=1 Tax=Chthoniobacter flavus Ellin428 TaxID=497964 RepID=B4D409_9BACT|nr:ATP-dependent DNA ligase [Chthoniobacter flavus]EDY18989.1 DNA ligase I, ATP-dependent Dnl1 [Chthoniobacter flavus Ellin428]TCO93570.1 DNA ligase-1 [Chthoniobacter flavus]
MISVRYHRGLELPEHGLWLDPEDPRPFAFVSHAHADHIARHPEFIASAGTARLMQARLGGERQGHILEFGQPASFRDFQITLLPAGHIFGSAQSLIESEHGSLLYTGDFKLRRGLSAEPTEWRHAETLIMETTYGLPKYRLPPTEAVMARMVAFCQESLEDGAVPVLLGYSLGKAQEILCAILKAGLTPMLHGAVYQMTEIYRQLKPDFPDGYERYSAGKVEGKVLICPPSANRTIMLTRIKNRRVAVLTGWALDPGATYRYQCDAAFPLSDHADYTDLVRYVDLVQPKRVLTLHGFAAAFAADLRERGFDAWALSEENQLELLLRRAPSTPQPERPAAPVAAMPQSEFGAFATLGDQIANSTSKLKKIALLADYLRSLNETQLPIAARFLTGRAFAQSDMRTLQVGWAVIKRAVMAAGGLAEQEFRAISRQYADAGKATYEALLERTTPRDFSLVDALALFDQLHAARGPLVKGELLQQRLAALTPLEASYLVKILTGDLRIGLKSGLVEEAIAAAFQADLHTVREAQMFTGDLGEVAALASKNQLEEASLHLFRPIQVMLASPEPTAQAVWSRIAAHDAPAAWTEDKFDGIRAQIHLGSGRAEIFTRDLRQITGQFADLARAARSYPGEAILDGEILAYEQGRRLTFFDLQKRLGRKTEDDLFLGANDIPVVFKAFDLLYLNGTSLLKRPLAERRLALESLTLPPGLEVAPIHRVASAEEIEAAFQAARARGNEGLMIKDGASFYTPGRRGQAWLKFKKELATLDVVVVGAEQGHGKRSHVLSDYTFAVRDEVSGHLLTIGKAYSGLTDEEIEELTEHFTATTIARHGRYREVVPEIVLEIAFDSIQPSDRHASGLAMRFPRIKAIRRDKTPEQIDTIAHARRLVATEMVSH